MRKYIYTLIAIFLLETCPFSITEIFANSTIASALTIGIGKRKPVRKASKKRTSRKTTKKKKRATSRKGSKPKKKIAFPFK